MYYLGMFYPVPRLSRSLARSVFFRAGVVLIGLVAAAGAAEENILMAPASAGLPSLPAVVRHETAAQHEGRLQWFRAARFGVFVHWGVYAVPAGMWQGKPTGAEWIMNQGKIPVAEYRALAQQFTAAKYDPVALAQLVADAGAKYIVITAKHHDGFALFETAVSDWNATQASAAKRDLIRPLEAAVRARGLRFGLYYSQSQDWVNLGGGKGNTTPWDDRQRQGDFDTYLKSIALPQVRELLDQYHPDIIWWDTEYSMTPERARPFFTLVESRGALLQNSRLGGGVLGDFRTSEQRIPANAMLGRVLEVNMTINNSWGYRADDVKWKSAEQLIRNLSDIASKDGNYLLNIGPTAEGVVPAPEVERLLAMGRWLKVNGEAIYNTRGGLYRDALPWGRTTSRKNDRGGTTLYLQIWNWPGDGRILLPGIQQKPRRGNILGSPAGAAALATDATAAGLVVILPGPAPDPTVSVAALEFSQPLVIEGGPALAHELGESGTLADPSKSPAANETPVASFQPRDEDKPLPPPAPVKAEFRFDFGGGPTDTGVTAVSGQDVYSSAKGFGFDFGAKVTSVRPTGNGAGSGYVTSSSSPFFFSVKVPEGNYRVTAVLGDAQGESSTTIRTEAGHIMAVDVKTSRGQTVRRVFYANVRRPELPPPPPNAPGGSMVHMFLAGEAESRAWDDRLTIEFNGPRPCLQSLEIVKDDSVPTVFTAGDSTVGDPRHGPAGNWPTQMCQFFKPEVAVCNSAEGGETSKSFITGQRLDKVLSQMKAGDFFLIQFGHNDSKPQWPQTYTDPASSFKAYLKVYMAETRRRGATIVFVTPMERRNNGDTVGPWARAMREVAAEDHVDLIDQWAMSKQLWTALGPKVGTAFADQTHLNGYGGYLLSKLIIRGIKANIPSLAKYVRDDFVDMAPSHPEPAPAYLQQASGSGDVRRARPANR